MARVDYPEVVRELISELKRLPGVGTRSAERIGIWLLQSQRANGGALADVLQRAKGEVSNCSVCGFFATAESCPVCDDSRRDDKRLCVVEQPAEVLPIERSGAFNGRYHCLGGKLSPLDHVTPEDLRIAELVKRVSQEEKDEPVEVVLAVGADVEGEATASYLAEVLRGLNCNVTRLAQGLPAGAGLEFADDLTLARAFEGRKNI